jgi:uncharacterized protein YndB with AHSA1/START domain
MSIKKDPSGRRHVQAEVEVPGTPEEVWEAIATGPGVSSWFVPTQKLADGRVVSHFGPGMDAIATQTAWEPPHRFAAESELGPGAPTMATEWIVEACSGSTCVVRVVHSLFASTDDWDDQLESIEAGWPDYFFILKLYLTHFRGQPCSAFQVMAVAEEPANDCWDRLAGGLGLVGARSGERRRATAGAPQLGGIVERTGEPGHPHQTLIRLEEPTSGIVHLFALAMGGQVYVSLRAYLYGECAAAAASAEEPRWRKWLQDRFTVLDDSESHS